VDGVTRGTGRKQCRSSRQHACAPEITETAGLELESPYQNKTRGLAGTRAKSGVNRMVIDSRRRRAVETAPAGPCDALRCVHEDAVGELILAGVK
jgi:hypothetical protein